MLGTNWKTSVLGILVIVVALGNVVIKFLSGQPIDMEDIAVLLGGSAGGTGLLTASDAK